MLLQMFLWLHQHLHLVLVLLTLPKGKSFSQDIHLQHFVISTHTGSKLSFCAKYKSILVIKHHLLVVQRNVCASGSRPHIIYILTGTYICSGFRGKLNYFFIKIVSICSVFFICFEPLDLYYLLCC